MSLNVDLRQLTQPGATGNETLSLPANFDPKVIIMWTSGLTTATAAHSQFGFGFGTYRGSTVQQRGVAVDMRDASNSGNTCRECYDNALCVLLISATTGSRDFEVDLVSMQGGATSQVVINWTNLATRASIRVHCLILGGSDITDALAFHVAASTGVSTQDVTVASGFGQPDLIFALFAEQAVNTISAHASLGLGFGKKGEAGRCLQFASFDGNTVVFNHMRQRSDHIWAVSAATTGTPSDDGLAALDTNPASNWPTDGFQLNYTTQAAFSDPILFLAIKGTFTATTGAGAAPITGTPPVVQDLDHGSVPKLGFLFGWNQAASTSILNAQADQAALFVGAGDGTDELLAGFCDDDGIGTSDANSIWSNTKVVQNYNNAAALQSEADGSISGNNFRLSWNDIDTVARQYQWLTLGDAVAGAYSGDLTAASFAMTAQSLTRLNAYVGALAAASFAFSAQALAWFVDWVGALSAAAFGFVSQELTRINKYVGELTSASFAMTAQALAQVVNITLTLSTPAFGFTANALAQITGFVADLTTASFGMTAQALTRINKYVGELTSASFALLARDLFWLTSGGAYVVELTSATFNMTTQALAYAVDFIVTLTTPTFNFAAQALTRTNAYVGALTTATFMMVGQALAWSLTFTASLSTAAFGFTAQTLTRLSAFSGQLTQVSFNMTTNAIAFVQDWIGTLTTQTFKFLGWDLIYTAGDEEPPPSAFDRVTSFLTSVLRRIYPKRLD